MEITRCQTLLSDHDIISQASIACKHGYFLDDLLVCNKHGFKILKLKPDVIPTSILTFDHENIKSADLAASCEGWYHYALEKGYFQTIEEVFPRHWWGEDFYEIDYAADIAGLQKQLDDLAAINMLDQEFVDALASGGAAYTEIASQVSAESTRAQGAEADITAAFQLADSTQSSGLIDGASVAGNTMKKLEDLISAEATRATDEEASITAAFQAADSTQSSGLIDGASAAGNTMKKLEDLISAEATRATGAEDAILGSPSADFNTLEKQEDKFVAESSAVAASFVSDRDKLVLLEATYTDTDVDDVCDVKIAALVNSAPQDLNTLKELADALASDASFSATMNSALAARVLSTTYTSEQQAQDVLIAGKEPSVTGTTAWAGATIPASKLDLSSKQNVIADADLSIAKTSGLQTALDSKEASVTGTTAWAGATIPASKLDLSSKQDVIGDGDLSIARTSGLQTALDSKEASVTGTTAWAGATIPASKLDLSSKQNVIADGDLSIARTSGLQSALNGKEASVTGTTAWAGATIPASKLDLSSKQNVIADGDLTIARTSGLQSALNGKEASVTGTTAWAGATIPASKLDLSSKQNLIADGDLTIARTSGLQTALDAKALDSSVVKKSGEQTITENGSGAVLVLNNSQSDAAILTCVGADGQIRLMGGNVLDCTRPGRMHVRCNDGTGSVGIQSRGTDKIVCDDQVRLKVAVQAESDFTCAANVLFSNLPTSDPGVAGRLYEASGFVKISLG